VFAPSIVYAPGDPWLTLLERLALLPVVPVSGRGRALYQPIWAEDVADCVIAVLRASAGSGERPSAAAAHGVDGAGNGAGGNGLSDSGGGGAAVRTSAERRAGAERRLRPRYELAGPETLSHTDLVRIVLRSLNRKRPLVHVPTPVVSRALRLLERVSGPNAFATWDEAELMEVPMVSTRGTADVEELGVRPARISAVLGVG